MDGREGVSEGRDGGRARNVLSAFWRWLEGREGRREEVEGGWEEGRKGGRKGGIEEWKEGQKCALSILKMVRREGGRKWREGGRKGGREERGREGGRKEGRRKEGRGRERE